MRVIEKLGVKPITDEVGDLVGQFQRVERNKDSLRSETGNSPENLGVSTNGAIPFEVTTPDTVSPVGIPEKSIKTVSEGEDEEVEAFWTDIEGFVEKYLTDLRERVEESVAQIEPLFEDAAFYKAQLEPLGRQGKLSEWSIAWKEFRLAERKLVVLYVFLSEGPAREHFGDLYLSTPEYVKLKAFSEDWYAQRETRIESQ